MVPGQHALGPCSLPWRELHTQGRSPLSSPLASYCPSFTPMGRVSTPSHEENRLWGGRRSVVQRPEHPGAVRLGSTPYVGCLQGPGSRTLVSSTTNTEGLLWYLERPLPEQGSCAQDNLREKQSPSEGNARSRQCE